MIRNHLLCWGMGWEHQPAKHASAVEACRWYSCAQVASANLSSGFDASSEVYGRGALSGNRKGSFWRLAFRIQAASPKLIILMAHALLDAQCQGAYLRSTGRARRLEDWFLLVVEISSAAEHHGTDPSKVLLNLRCLSKCILMQHLSIRRHGAHRTPTKYQSLCMNPQEGIAAESALKQEQRRTTG